MTDELDPGLKRLFAATAEHPADEAFVAEATAKASGRRRTVMLARVLAGVLLPAAVFAAAALALAPALAQSAGVIAALAKGSPMGWTAGLALLAAGAVCLRAVRLA